VAPLTHKDPRPAFRTLRFSKKEAHGQTSAAHPLPHMDREPFSRNDLLSDAVCSPY
jgi:hypothetical protein